MDKKCICGSIKRGSQEKCDECHEKLSKCKTISERVEYFLEKCARVRKQSLN